MTSSQSRSSSWPWKFSSRGNLLNFLDPRGSSVWWIGLCRLLSPSGRPASDSLRPWSSRPWRWWVASSIEMSLRLPDVLSGSASPSEAAGYGVDNLSGRRVVSMWCMATSGLRFWMLIATLLNLSTKVLNDSPFSWRMPTRVMEVRWCGRLVANWVSNFATSVAKLLMELWWRSHRRGFY